MKLTMELYRVAVIQTDMILGTIGFNDKDKVPGWIGKAQDMLLAEFGPMTPGVKIFWNDYAHTVVGNRVMSFDVGATSIPVAGLVECDPMDPAMVSRADGALEGELSRLGIPSFPEAYQWRVFYSLAWPATPPSPSPQD